MMLHAIASSPGNDGSRAHHGSPSGLRRRFAGGFLRSARALAAAALLALSGSLALPATAQAQTTGICDRTQKVYEAILGELSGVSDCAAVTAADLASITLLDLRGHGITSLKSGDFAGLTSMTRLNVGAGNTFTEIPDGVFAGLTALRDLDLSSSITLSSLSAGAFAGLTALEELSLDAGALTELPAEVFSGLTSLKILDLASNPLSSLPAGAFADLTSLTNLDLSTNALTELPAGVFSGLTLLASLNLSDSALRSLPGTPFSDTPLLRELYLHDNSLTTLPDGMFSGLTRLTFLTLGGNAVDPLRLTVTVEKVGTDQVRAVVPSGAPFTVDIPVRVVNGTLAGGASTLRVAQGSVYGRRVTLTSTPGATVTVDVDQANPPRMPVAHSGYGFLGARSDLSAPISGIVPKTCKLNPGDVWCGTVTVGEVAEASGKTIGYGFHETWHGNRVGYMHDGTIGSGENLYTIDEAMVGVGVATAGDDRILFFSLNRALTAADRARLVLHIGSDKFALSDAQFESGTHTYHWRNTGLDWSSTSSVTPRLRASPAAPTAVRATAPPRTGGLLEVEWSAPASAPAGSITDYEVKYWKAADPENENRRSRTARTESAGTRLLIYPFLDASTEYELRVRARNAIGWGAWSEVATARTGAKRPTNPIVSLAVVDASGNDIDRITGGETFRYRVKVRELLNHHRSSGRDFTGWGTLGVRGPIAIEYFNDDVRSGCHGETLFLEDFTWETFTTGYWEFDSVEIPADAGPVRLRMGFGCRASHTNAGLPLTGFVTTTSRSFQLGSPVRACLSVADSEGTVTNACPAGEGGARALKARFMSPPERHDGSGRVKVRVAFSEAIEESPENVGEHGVKVEGGRVTSVRRVDNRPGGGEAGRSAGRSGDGQKDGQEDGERVWEFEIEPGSGEDLTMRIDGGRPCDEPGAICTEDGRSLSEGIATTVVGPGPAPLTAAFQGVPESHDGEDAFHFRVAFSEEIGIGFRSMRDASFTVDGGEVTRARRVDGRHDLWRITVEPETDGAVMITLPGGRECGVSGAICTRGGDRRRLTNTATATVAGPVDEAAVVALTASFVQAPAEHDGETAFKLRIAFSEGISISFRTFRDASLSVSGGSVTKAKRVDRRKDLWEATVKPGSIGDVTVTLEGGRACGTPGAVCTGDGRALSATISTRVLGPPGLSVADAEVDEGPDAALAFVVRLDRAPSSRVTVDYATADGTAKAGSDYTAVSGALTFAAGERTKTVSVAVLDDAHDEGSETLTLTLSNATGAYIEDGTATGTIKNTDHMPKAWLARFGRTVAEQVLDAVGARIEGNSNSPGPARLTLGGHQVVLDASWPGADGTLLGDAGVLGPDLREAKDLLRAEADDSTAGEISTAGLLMASSFHMASAGGEDESGRWSLWARGSRASFSGKEDALTLEGDVSTGLVGADYERGRVLAGVALAYSTGEGSYTEADARGELESTLASVHPYLRYTVSDRLSVWGVLGLGEGGLTLDIERDDERIETDISLAMVAFGARGKLASVAGYDLEVKTDVLFVQTESEAATGLVSADAQTRRLRLALEGSREVKFESGVLTPSLEIGLRHDGGDAETGSGVELGGGLRWTNSGGLTMEVRARGLIAHEERDYEEWGVSASLALSPGGDGRGLSMRVGSAWGAASGGTERLWAQRAVAGGEFDPDAGLNAEVGYGLDAWRGLLTPYTGVALTGGGETWRAGARWKLGPAFALNLEATLAEPEGDGEHEAGLVLRGSKRW